MYLLIFAPCDFSFLPTFAESVIGIPAEFYEEIKSELIAPNKEG